MCERGSGQGGRGATSKCAECVCEREGVGRVVGGSNHHHLPLGAVQNRGHSFTHTHSPTHHTHTQRGRERLRERERGKETEEERWTEREREEG